MEQNRKFRNRPTQTCSTDFQQRGQGYSIGGRIVFQQKELAQLDIYMRRKKLTLDPNLTQYTKINSEWDTEGNLWKRELSNHFIHKQKIQKKKLINRIL